MTIEIEKRFNEWMEKVEDETLQDELFELQKDDTALTNAFYKDLEFGTGGLRGEIGVGTNCLNIYTIRKVTRGIAQSMMEHNQKVACVSCDSRINSNLFKEIVAEVFASCNIKAYVTKELMPTPFLSYITRYMHADIGVMITASHNPSKYNGYKVYGSDGCQLTDNSANAMIEYINRIDPFTVQTLSFNDYLEHGMVEYIDDQVIEDFLTEVKKENINSASGLKVTYSPLNGTGYKLVPEILRRINVEELCIVKEQGYPDGNFPTCSYPNPEKPAALKLGLEYAKKNDSDILIATDPDCDRVGIAVKHNGEYVLLTGNEVGVLLSDYLLRAKKQNGTLVDNPIIVKTIVTSSLVNKIAQEYNATVENVLTGFKYIGDIIGKLEKKGETDRYVLGFEESYGYLSGTYVRDKDAVNGSMLIAEMTAYYKREGKTLVDVLESIYNKYGVYQHRLTSYEFPGATGNAKMKELLSALRNNLPTEIAGSKVIETIDYLTQTQFDLPKANVLSFKMEDASQLIIRPSGTEPLIKMYLTATKNKQDNEKKFELMKQYLDSVFR